MYIGFIGLGIMGKPMAKNLLKAGYELVVFDVVEAPLKEVVAAGAKAATSPSDVASQCEIIITMLPNSPHVRKAILGKGGVIEGVKSGSIVVDMSSIAPLASREVAAELAAKGVEMLDAPVSGGEPKAIDGTLAIMVGGKQEVFDKVKDILLKVGSSAVLCGDIGAGQVTKLANQIIVAANIAALAEALTLAMKSGVDPELVFDAIKGGLAGSTVMNAKAPMMMDRNYKPGFRISLHIKDLQNALSAGQNTGTPLPLTAFAMEMMQAIKNDGHLEADHSALVHFHEKLANIEVHRTAK